MVCRAAPSTSLLSRPSTKQEAGAANLQLWRPTVSTNWLKAWLFLHFMPVYYIACLFHQANPLNWIQNLRTRNWRCHMTTWQWSGMRPLPKKATARSVSAARAATEWLEMSTSTVVGTTGRLWLAGAHGEGFVFLKMLISRIEFCISVHKIMITIKLHSYWCVYKWCNCAVYSSGTLWA